MFRRNPTSFSGEIKRTKIFCSDSVWRRTHSGCEYSRWLLGKRRQNNSEAVQLDGENDSFISILVDDNANVSAGTRWLGFPFHV
jgi:hypothetical protein